MVRDNEIRLLSNGFRRAVGCDGQACHHTRRNRIAAPDEQTDIVPLLGQCMWREVSEIVSDVLNGWHRRDSS